ncbi:Unconventional myosin-XIX [Trifolium repens]|nr:Unconventional myosin-XIX [Trifolium repens]
MILQINCSGFSGKRLIAACIVYKCLLYWRYQDLPERAWPSDHYWCYEATGEYIGSNWDELKHTRQAIGFLAGREDN